MKSSIRIAALFALLLPSAAVAQGSQGVGSISKPTAPTAVQLGGKDPGGLLRLLETDASGRLKVANAGVAENAMLATANVKAAPATLFGGTYIFNQSCTGYNGGTLALRYQGADGVTMVTLLGKVASDTSGGTMITLGANSVVDVSLPTGSTACNASIVRVP
ncbi:hypothetical protein [Sphingobium yanoikuyae]|uniref:hypothetical protein n=1 Tax=Sphingobium yanoikuyae TaxID=13690 RepID=UPI002FDE6BAD